MRRLLIAPLAVLAFAAQGPDSFTPDGPATLYSDWHGAMTLEGDHPELLTGYRVTVQPGGRAGTIRLLVFENPPFGEQGPRMVHVGQPVLLPAEPGAYTFPAPHVFADYRSVTYGIEQETGGHAITAQIRCSPEEGESDICNDQSVDVYQPPLGGAIPDRRTASQVLRGRELTIDPITEPDVDGDGAGDETEDRTNLRASATTRRLPGWRRAFDVTVENAGPRTADRPKVDASFFPSPGLGTWSPACVGEQAPYYGLRGGNDDPRLQSCLLAPLAAGERRTVRLVVPDLGPGDAYFSVSAEGRDLAGGDETAGPDVRGPRPPLSLEVNARVQSLANLRVTVRSSHRGTVRLLLRRGKRDYARTIRFARAGKRDVVLRPPRRLGQERGVVTLTARSGGATARARLQSAY